VKLPHPFQDASSIKPNADGTVSLTDAKGKPLARIPLTTAFDLSPEAAGYGSGDGHGYGLGYSDGYGLGYGDGYGYGCYGDGRGNGRGDGHGRGIGCYGDGHGDGDGYGKRSHRANGRSP